MAVDLMEQIVSLAKRRGFVYPSAELYGGTGAVWDFGPYGNRMKNNIKSFWYRRFVQERDDIIDIDSAILIKREVLAASGHEKQFNDMMVECKKCKQRFRADHQIPEAKDHKHDLGEPKQFNLMFKTNLGPVEDPEHIGYLRPETAQGMFTNFKTILDTSRKKVPFGIAQIGKSFRNEITTGNFIFRAREFEIGEIEFFVKPGTDDEWFKKWVDEWGKFFEECGLKKEKLRRYNHPKESLAHYSKGTTDYEYEFPFGWGEIAGIANRTDFDLKAHEKHSGKELRYFDEKTGEKYVPYVIEPTLGIERLMLALLVDGYDVIKPATSDQQPENQEYVLRLNPKIAPIKAAVFPLVNKDKLPAIAREIYEDLRAWKHVEYDDSGSIGRRYRRQDEIGTIAGITVDFQTLKDNTVTIRDRDTMKQIRIKRSEIRDVIGQMIEGKEFKKLGKIK